MKLSILLPSLFPALARAAIEDWREQLRGIEHEFVVVSPHEIGGERVRWVQEAKSDGAVAATHFAFASAKGEVLIHAADDARFADGAAAQALSTFADPSRKFPLALTFPHREKGLDLVYAMFGRLYPTFCAVGRLDAERAGGLIDNAFRAGFSDCDFGMRIWREGGEVRRAKAVIKIVNDRLGNPESPTKTRTVLDQDFATFRARWAPSFDPIWGTDEGGMNLMLSTEFLPLLSPDPDTLNIDGRAAARDLRIARAMTVAAWTNNAPLGRNVAESGLTYLRWLSKQSGDPAQVVVRDWYWAGVTRAGGAPQSG